MRTYWIGLFLLGFRVASAQVSVDLGKTMMYLHQDSIAYADEGKKARWDYEQGILLKAMERLWEHTGDVRYFKYVQRQIDPFISENGEIATYEIAKYNIDMITPGRTLLTLYQQTLPKKEKYKRAADLLLQQIEKQPRTQEGGFWHKQIYPYQMWLDGLYMGQPFYAEYAQVFQKPTYFDDIVNQFVWMERHARDPQTGLLYHAWDESKQQAWADKVTGQSPNFWTRAMGWYAMALVDVLDYIPVQHPRRVELITILNRFLPALLPFQDPKTGGWYQVTNRPEVPGNYIETSGTSMFIYALAKSVRKRYIAPIYLAAAKKAFDGIQKHFLTRDELGYLHLENTVSVSGLGGKPYRDGSVAYYLSEKIRRDDLKGVGPLIFAAIEMEIAESPRVDKPVQVGLDYHFNREFRKDETGQMVPYHYTWEDRLHSGFWWWGQAFERYGATLQRIQKAPRRSDLEPLSVYIIVDPDTRKESEKPNFMDPTTVKEIQAWVKSGGTLVLMANDSANCELPKFNTLAKVFGIEFTNTNLNMVVNNQFEQGSVQIVSGNRIFKNTQEIFVKELSVLAVQPPAQALVQKEGSTILAVSTFGKGRVFAIGDPWLYNEYVDGRKIPANYQNYSALHDLTRWLLNLP